MEPFIPATIDIVEIDPFLTPEEKNDGGDKAGNIVEISDKLNEGSETGGETDHFSGASTTATEVASTSSYVDTVAPEQGFSTLIQDTGGKPVSPMNSSSTTINLQERARERSQIRQSSRNVSSSSKPQGRVLRGRGVRGDRNGRGQSPG